MTAGSVNFKVETGATFNSTLVWTDENGTPINLTGYTAVMNITAPKSLESSTYFTLSTANSRITFDALSGTIYLHIDASDTATFNWEKGYGSYKLELTSGSTVYRLLEGSVILND